MGCLSSLSPLAIFFQQQDIRSDIFKGFLDDGSRLIALLGFCTTMMQSGNELLGRASSDESDIDQGYDSEAAEIPKASRRNGGAARASKRRKLSHVSSESDQDSQSDTQEPGGTRDPPHVAERPSVIPSKASLGPTHLEELQNNEPTQATSQISQDIAEASSRPNDPPQVALASSTTSRNISKKRRKPLTPGVIYLSSLPPYLRPSALRNLISARGFTPIKRLFLTPASETSSRDKPKNTSRQLYTEGWIEFPSKHTAKECVAALNAQPVGGKKEDTIEMICGTCGI